MHPSLIPSWLTWRKIVTLFALAICIVLVTIWRCDVCVRSAAAGHCHNDVQTVPPTSVALLLGCSPTLAGNPNLFFTHRITAAAKLYRAGKVKAFIVSGDNGSKSYDEPTAMKECLISQGIPSEAIYCDFAGFRTLDSVIRARSIFGQSRVIIVSQHFHNERAIFLARQHGLEAIGYNATEVSREIAPTTYLREFLARVQAVLDVVLNTRPKFEGPPVVISQKSTA